MMSGFRFIGHDVACLADLPNIETKGLENESRERRVDANLLLEPEYAFCDFHGLALLFIIVFAIDEVVEAFRTENLLFLSMG